VRANEKKLTHERLLEVLAFNQSSGAFTWLVTRNYGGRPGYINHHGDRIIQIDGAFYNALRLAYFYENGHWPSGAVIPADGYLDNTRIANLRVVPEISPAELPKKRSDLTVEMVRKLFFYEGGRLFWACNCGKKIRFGMEAGTVNHYGYRVISIQEIKYQAHQIAWAHHHGEWLSEGEIDHENRVKGDNRIENLRKATHQENMANRCLSKTVSNTGVVGVHKHRNGKYKASCGSGKKKHIGSFSNLDDAILARQAAAQARWGEFARH
jgi:hypothetical protein